MSGTPYPVDPDGNPALASFSGMPVGLQTSVPTASLAAAYTLVKPATATGFIVQNTGTQTLRWTNDGTLPTSTHGYQLGTGKDPTILPCPPGVTIKMIREADGAALEYGGVK